MKRGGVLLMVALLLAAPLFFQTQASAQDAETTVKVAESPALGQYFTDADGRTLYLWTVDVQAGASNCYGPCVDFWPLFTADEPLSLPSGVDGKLSIIERTDGTKQVAYNDIPLYYFSADTKPGDTFGQWVGDSWFVVAPGEQFGQAATKVQADIAASPVAASTTLVIAHDPTLGDYFTDAAGRTVYLFTKDSAIFTSACTGDCLANWPPVPAPTGRLTLSADALGELAPMNGNDGKPQLAYNGIPLYYFAGDSAPGQTNGQGVNGVWWVVKPGAQLGQATPTAGASN